VRDLAALLFDKLRELARREMSKERRDHALQPTALVNEAYMRLVGSKDAGCWEVVSRTLAKSTLPAGI